MYARSVGLVAIVLVLLLAGVAAQSPQPVTQADCPALPAVHAFAEWPRAMENLAFSGGAVYVSDIQAESLVRFDAEGQAEVVVAFTDLHGVVAGPDGAIYFAGRDSAAPLWRAWRLGPEGPERYSGPTRGWNGMAFNDVGDLFMSDHSGEGVYRIPADDPSRPELWLEVAGANGLAFDPESRILYVALSDDQRSTILRVSMDDPGATTEIHLTFGAFRFNRGGPPFVEDRPASDPTLPLVPKVLDDLTLGPDGMLYAVAQATGELLRVDPETGAACVLARGLREPTSVRVATGFGDYDGDLFVTTFGGNFFLTQFASPPPDLQLPDLRPPRQPALLRIATGLEMPAAVPGPVEPALQSDLRDAPGPSAVALFAGIVGVLLVSLGARSDRFRR